MKLILSTIVLMLIKWQCKNICWLTKEAPILHLRVIDYFKCQALRMPKMPKLTIYLPAFQAHNINKSIPSPGGETKTKTFIKVSRNNVDLAPTLENRN